MSSEKHKYNRLYNFCLNYVLPFRKFDESYKNKDFVNEIASTRNFSVENVIDIYVNIAVNDVPNRVLRMIQHDGVCNRKNKNCIIDDTAHSGLINEILKKDCEKKKNLN